MGNPSAAHEPSMEEILASIRQIISEDGEQAEGEAEPSQGQGASAAAQAVDVAAEPEEIEATVSAAAPAPPLSADATEDAAQPSYEEASPLAAAPASPPEQPRLEPTLRRQAAQSPVDQPSQPSAGAAQQYSTAAKPAPEAPRQAAMGSGLPAAASMPSGNDRLLSPQADASVSGAFSALAHTILAQNARTLEDLVSEMLRPMLKDWLDDNLPPLVERLVKEEIERVSRGRR
jgi:uncharacterized protein